MSDSVPQLVRVGSLRVEVGTPIDESVCADGVRRSIPILGGTLEGDLGVGVVQGGGADRQIVHEDGSISIDASYQIALADSSMVSVRSVGVRAFRTDDVYFRTGIRMTTSADRPDLNGHLFVSSGYRADNTVVLELFRVT